MNWWFILLIYGIGSVGFCSYFLYQEYILEVDDIRGHLSLGDWLWCIVLGLLWPLWLLGLLL